MKSNTGLIRYLPGFVIVLGAMTCSCGWLSGSTTTETKLGSYHIVFTPSCDNLSSHIETKKHADGTEDLLTAQCDCGTASVLIRGDELIVNGQTYGQVKNDD